MPSPRPVPGLVIRYSYLSREQHQRGQEEGVKDRPCAVILVMASTAGQEIVTVLPITHASPSRGATAIEIPPLTKVRLGLDDERSWVILTEANRFLWPGPDLRPVRGGDIGTIAYGLLPYDFMEEIRAKFAELLRSRLASIVRRTE